jgi:hypothetical protein
MRMDKEMRVSIEDIARVALENQDISEHIGRELGLTEQYLDEVYTALEAIALLNEGGV